MTLIVGFKTAEGAVICADSQETLGLPLPGDDFAEYRVSVDKIEPQQVGMYDLVIGGAGYSPLVEGFSEALTDQIETWDAELDGASLKEKIRNVVLDYHRHEVAVCPAKEKEIQFLICLKQKDDPTAEIHLWAIRGPAIKRVKNYELVGWEEGIYRHDIDRHYRNVEKHLFSILVGVHVLMLAKGTSNNVGGPIKIVVATPAGFRAIAPEDAAELERRVTDFDSALDAIRLRICDTTIPLDAFNQDISDFQTATLNLRLTLTGEIILARFHRLLTVKTVEDLALVEDPYLGLPTLEESTRALMAAWGVVTKNRRTKRDLAIASLHLSLASNLVVKVISEAYKTGLISLGHRREFAKRCFEINEAGKWALDEHRRKVTVDPVPDALVTAIYSHLTDQVVRPLLAVADDFFKLLEISDERGNQIMRGMYAGLLSVFTMAFFSPASKEPESLTSTPKELSNGNRN